MGLKAVTRISFVETMADVLELANPAPGPNCPTTSYPDNETTYMLEYGPHGNVKPDVPHRRYSQTLERSLMDASWPGTVRNTRLFNGYAKQVGHLYEDVMNDPTYFY